MIKQLALFQDVVEVDAGVLLAGWKRALQAGEAYVDIGPVRVQMRVGQANGLWIYRPGVVAMMMEVTLVWLDWPDNLRWRDILSALPGWSNRRHCEWYGRQRGGKNEKVWWVELDSDEVKDEQAG